MKRNNPSKQKLPFSFKKKAVSAEKINGHWQKIAEQIASKQNAGEPGNSKRAETNDPDQNNAH
ncbi:hypothetical protein [Pedobacter heparinus]|uniref:hypothetical protein n=1 Tax=Pedobacter heparinus TaxID=984 RepID=UPI0029318730|nr:hypothetical protein [Pedobacter heparinus]